MVQEFLKWIESKFVSNMRTNRARKARKPDPWVGNCPKTNKRQYATLEDANNMAKQLRKRRGPKCSGYKCIHCGLYHYGHKRPPHRRKGHKEWASRQS